MKKIFSSLFFFYMVILASAEFKEIPMLEESPITEKKKQVKIENIEREKPIEESSPVILLEKKIEEELESEKIVEVEAVREESEERGEKILVKEELSEAKLQEIIEKSKSEPVPEVVIDVDVEDSERVFLTPDMTAIPTLQKVDPNSLVKKYYDFLESFNEKLEKHNFENKTEVIHIGHEVAKELTSDKVLPNFELGVGMTYQGDKGDIHYFEQEQSGNSYRKEVTENGSEWESVPVYATGKLRLPKGENGEQPYLKLNFGYAVNSIGGKDFQTSDSRYKSINDSLNYDYGAYYGMGWGIEYNNGLTLDLMYRVNEGKNSTKDNDGESRVTFSVEYKLDI